MSACKSMVTNATTAEQEVTIQCLEVKLIANDSTTNDLILSFGTPISEGNYIVIKPQEKRVNYPVNFNKLYYKSSSGTVPFRFECIIS